MTTAHVPEYQVIEDARRQFALYGDEPIQPELPEDLEALWHMKNNLASILQAAKAVKVEVEAAMAAQLAPGEAVRLGDEIHQVKTSYRRKVKDKQAFWEFVAQLPTNSVALLFNPDTVRVTGLRAAAASQGISEEAIEDTFFEMIWGVPGLQSKPIDRSAEWTKALQHGERRTRG